MTVAEEKQKAVWERALGVSINFPEDDTDIDPREAFSRSPIPRHAVTPAALHQRINELPRKQAAIARALVHKGVVVWAGIPEHVIEELELAGYKIKKRKSFRGRSGQ